MTRRQRSSSPVRSPPRSRCRPSRCWWSTSAAARPSWCSARGSERHSVSMDIGSVRLHERHLHSDPPTAAEVAACVADIDAHLDASGIPLERARTRDRHVGHDQDARLRRARARRRTTARPSTARCCPTPTTADFVDSLVAMTVERATGPALHAPRPRRRHRRGSPDLERHPGRAWRCPTTWSPRPTSCTASPPPSVTGHDAPAAPGGRRGVRQPGRTRHGLAGRPRRAGTPVARDADDVRRLAPAADLAELDARVSVCSACPRLVTWREDVATREAGVVRRPALLGPADPRLGRRRALAADRRARAGGQRRQPDRTDLHRRPQRRLALREPAPHRVGQPGDERARRRRSAAARRPDDRDGPLRAAGEQADARSSATPARPGSPPSSRCCRPCARSSRWGPSAGTVPSAPWSRRAHRRRREATEVRARRRARASATSR